MTINGLTDRLNNPRRLNNDESFCFDDFLGTMTMNKVVMYSSATCPFCTMAERLLRSRGVDEIEKIRVDLDLGKRTEMIEKTHRRTVPQIFIGSTYVGGFDELSALDRKGKLAELLTGD